MFAETRQGKQNMDRFASAYGEADVQPSLLPEYFSTPTPKSQGLFHGFMECKMLNAEYIVEVFPSEILSKRHTGFSQQTDKG